MDDFISACFFLQFAKPVPYDVIMGHMVSAIKHLDQPVVEPIYDPPWSSKDSPLFAFFDLNVIEYLVFALREQDPIGCKMLIKRLKMPVYANTHDATILFDLFSMRLFVWYCQKLIRKVCK